MGLIMNPSWLGETRRKPKRIVKSIQATHTNVIELIAGACGRSLTKEKVVQEIYQMSPARELSTYRIWETLVVSDNH